LVYPARAEQRVVAPIAIPSLGWVFDSEIHALRPVSGILGAALVGAPIDIGFPIQMAAIASERAVALAISSEDEQLYCVPLGRNVAAARKLDTVNVSPDKLVLSTSGNSAILYFSKAGRIQIITGLPDTISVESSVAVDSIAGVITNLAINDAGDLILITAREGEDTALWRLDDAGHVSVLPVRASEVAVAFQSHSRNAVAVTSAGEMYSIQSDGSISHYGLLGENSGVPVGLQLTGNGSVALIAYNDGSIVEANTISGAVRKTTCGCTPTGLHRVNTSAVFRLNEASALPLLLVQQVASGPLLWFVPPVVRESGNSRGEQ
jgi:hypothetical protein